MKEYKRLTERGEGGEVLLGGCPTCDHCFDCYFAELALVRLAELEDKIERGELVENTVMTYVNMARSGSKTLIDKALKYDELKSKIENGTLIELPCKVGDKLYYIDGFQEIMLGEVSMYWILNEDYITFEFVRESGSIDTEDLNAIGKEIFLTKAEAEAKLKEQQNER